MQAWIKKPIALVDRLPNSVVKMFVQIDSWLKLNINLNSMYS